MPTSKKFLIPAFLVVVGLLVLWIWKIESTGKPDLRWHAGNESRTPHAVARATNPLLSTLGRLREKPDRAGALQTLKELQATLQTMPRDEALAWIRAFLESGQDQTTGLSFEIDSSGALTEWPTLRTFLLDALLTIDPAAAATLSRAILTTPTSADEWALALRNVGRAESSAAANAYLIERTAALIANPAWQADPSIGYLNAFDVLVHTHATDSTPLLSGLIQQKDRRDLAHAGFLTLDRLVQSDPAAVLPQLAADRALQQSRPEMVANMLARADLRDATQQQLVRTYLLEPTRTAAELNAFDGVYPSANFAISNNLLTANPTLARDEIAARDTAALGIITTWLDDTAFASIKPHLATIHNRLTTFVGQTRK